MHTTSRVHEGRPCPGEKQRLDDKEHLDQRERVDGKVRLKDKDTPRDNSDVKGNEYRQQLRHLLICGGSLQPLCWLLLHPRPRVSAGAAQVLSTLSSSLCASNTGSDGSSPDWATSMIEQGCVPILWMIAGRNAGDEPPLQAFERNRDALTAGSLAARSQAAGTRVMQEPQTGQGTATEFREEETASTRRAEHVEKVGVTAVRRAKREDVVVCRGEPAGSSMPGKETAAARDHTTAPLEQPAVKAASRGSGDVVCKVARSLLRIIGTEALTTQLARLVRMVSCSGNRDLQANVVVALVLLSLGAGHEDIGSKVN